MFQGAHDRADRQLDIVLSLATSPMPRLALIRQLIRADLSREEFFRFGRPPEFMTTPGPRLERLLALNVAIRAGDGGDVADLVGAIEAQDVGPSARCNRDGRAAAAFIDLDDRTSGLLEILTATGVYIWADLHEIQSIDFHRATMLHEVLWRRADVALRNGPSGSVFVPMRYWDAAYGGEDRFRCGRETDWVNDSLGFSRGIGQRCFLCGDDVMAIGELASVVFADDRPEMA